eukprot:gnl/MRDRNA2_/MRDRNA2_104862_c0_seq1.p1 gnl/MRDRNA2_/MRDRNA2_104862_c0~~gnl/MRDRNA2_/MRDRNA2_104862_c0_seq1.p1  ORF type:complete len:233 (-),score=36.31 gnl/MRDRNA2_/MRDRNA2_104862_c0_seq1:7-705(-)
MNWISTTIIIPLSFVLLGNAFELVEGGLPKVGLVHRVQTKGDIHTANKNLDDTTFFKSHSDALLMSCPCQEFMSHPCQELNGHHEGAIGRRLRTNALSGVKKPKFKLKHSDEVKHSKKKSKWSGFNHMVRVADKLAKKGRFKSKVPQEWRDWAYGRKPVFRERKEEKWKYDPKNFSLSLEWDDTLGAAGGYMFIDKSKTTATTTMVMKSEMDVAFDEWLRDCNKFDTISNRS